MKPQPQYKEDLGTSLRGRLDAQFGVALRANIINHIVYRVNTGIYLLPLIIRVRLRAYLKDTLNNEIRTTT